MNAVPINRRQIKSCIFTGISMQKISLITITFLLQANDRQIRLCPTWDISLEFQ